MNCWRRRRSFKRAEGSFPFVQNYTDRSATEIEILYGAFIDANGAPRMRRETSRFYFGQEAAGFGGADEGPHAVSRLAALKKAIYDAELPVTLPDYRNPEDLANAIHDDIMAMVERDYPTGGERSWLEGERIAHAAFGETWRRSYVPAEGAMKALNTYAAADGPEIALVSGPSGCGKSALLANWAESWKERYASDFVFVHFVGGSDESARLTSLTRRIYEEIRGSFPEVSAILMEKPKPTCVGNVDLEEALSFCAWLTAIERALPRRVVLVLDALDQLLNDAGAQRLQWLPSASPCLRVVVSCVPGKGEAYDAARQHQHVLCPVEPLHLQHRQAVVHAELQLAGKELPSALLDRLCGATQSVNPLFLLTVVHELRDAAVFDTLEARLSECLACPDSVSLFGIVMQRWSQQYGKTLVRDTMQALVCSRYGLAVSELQQVLGVGGQGAEVTPLRWLEFTSAASALLVDRGALVDRGSSDGLIEGGSDGLWSFFHRAAEEAVEATFELSDAMERRRVHKRLGEFFASQPPSQRRADEGPWQLARAGEGDRLAGLIAELDVLRRFSRDRRDATRHEIVSYWVESGRAQEAAEMYKRSFDLAGGSITNEGETVDDLDECGLILKDLGQHAEAKPILQRVLAMRQETLGQEHRGTAASLTNLAFVYHSQGDYDEAKSMFKRALAISEATLGPTHPDTATTLNNLALVAEAQGKFEEAEPLYQRALAIREASLGPKHPDTASSLSNLAAVYYAHRKYDDAEHLYTRALAITEAARGPTHPSTARFLSNLAELYRSKRIYDQAEPLLKRALAITERALGPMHVDMATCLNNLAGLYYSQGIRRYSEAEMLFKRALAIREGALKTNHPDTALSLNNLAELYTAQGRYNEAEPLYKRALAILETALGPMSMSATKAMSNLGEMYCVQGRFDEAEPLLKRALAVREATAMPSSSQPEIAESLHFRAGLHVLRGQYSEAEPVFKRALAIREAALGPNHPDTASTLNNLAELYRVQGRHYEAGPLHKRALAIRQEVLGLSHAETAKSLGNLALAYASQGRYSEAEPMFKQALAITEEALGPVHVDVARALNNLADLGRLQGKYTVAEPLYKRAVKIAEVGFGPTHPSTAAYLNNLGLLFRFQQKYNEAEPIFKRALAIREAGLGPQHPDTGTSLNNLATTYHYQGKLNLAEPLYKRAHVIAEATRGLSHPFTAASLNSIALLAHSQGKFDEAEPLLKRALAIRESTLGPNHPETAGSLNDLGAFLLLRRGKVAMADAISMLERALNTRNSILGSAHPDTQCTAEWIARAYGACGRSRDAARLRIRATQS